MELMDVKQEIRRFRSLVRIDCSVWWDVFLGVWSFMEFHFLCSIKLVAEKTCSVYMQVDIWNTWQIHVVCYIEEMKNAERVDACRLFVSLMFSFDVYIKYTATCLQLTSLYVHCSRFSLEPSSGHALRLESYFSRYFLRELSDTELQTRT